MRSVALVVSALLAGCDQAVPEGAAEKSVVVQPKHSPLPFTLTALEKSAKSGLDAARAQRQVRDLEARAKRAMETYLFDPFTARYRSLRLGRGGAICGQMNARNRMGAYVGFKDFVVGRDGRRLWVSGSSDGIRSELYTDFTEAYFNACATRSETNQYRIAVAPYGPSWEYDEAPYVPDPTDAARADFYAAEGGYEDNATSNSY